MQLNHELVRQGRPCETVAVSGNAQAYASGVDRGDGCWGVTFVQVKDAVALDPLFAFLALRFAIASAALAVPGTRRVRSLGCKGVEAAALLGLLLAQPGGWARFALIMAGIVVAEPVAAQALRRALRTA